jgi:hypothetical protein
MFQSAAMKELRLTVPGSPTICTLMVTNVEPNLASTSGLYCSVLVGGEVVSPFRLFPALHKHCSLFSGLLLFRHFGFRYSTKSTHQLNVDAKEHSLNRQIAGLFAPLRQRISPPCRILGKLLHCMFTLRRVLHLIQFQVRSSHYYANPIRLSSYFVGL